MRTVIKVENLSKAYQLGQFGTGTLSKDLERWWALKLGKEDPFLKIGEENVRNKKGESDFVWSLKDLNFEIKEGSVVGIIGKNGAGKSTLLKLLSQVTSPTSGKIKIKGRLASLLEVGTGFHPELTGRENIFLNGAILGMRKNEITKKFDEIVNFAGVERYIDTPVKRYSSGMYVRLAFAVAAHLESEILIVDEVLAVGDADFQKKCMGKMGQISQGEGRTILFVSHNMSSIAKLCSKGILLNNGRISSNGDIDQIIDTYINNSKFSLDIINISTTNFQLKEVKMVDENYEDVFTLDVNKRIGFKITILRNSNLYNSIFLGLNLYNEFSKALISTVEFFENLSTKEELVFISWLPQYLFTDDQQFRLRLTVFSEIDGVRTYHFDIKDVIILNVIESNKDQRLLPLKDKFHSILSPKFSWEIL